MPSTSGNQHIRHHQIDGRRRLKEPERDAAISSIADFEAAFDEDASDKFPDACIVIDNQSSSHKLLLVWLRTHTQTLIQPRATLRS